MVVSLTIFPSELSAAVVTVKSLAILIPSEAAPRKLLLEDSPFLIVLKEPKCFFSNI